MRESRNAPEGMQRAIPREHLGGEDVDGDMFMGDALLRQRQPRGADVGGIEGTVEHTGDCGYATI